MDTEIRFSGTRGKYGYLSNFSKHSLVFKDIGYLNSEAAFQAQKTLNKSMRLKFSKLSASDAKKLGRSVELRPDWETIKYADMVSILNAKLYYNPELVVKLLSTKGRTIVEDTTGWHDNIWGDCQCNLCKGTKGKNLLGKAWMEVRDWLKWEVAKGTRVLDNDTGIIIRSSIQAPKELYTLAHEILRVNVYGAIYNNSSNNVVFEYKDEFGASVKSLEHKEIWKDAPLYRLITLANEFSANVVLIRLVDIGMGDKQFICTKQSNFNPNNIALYIVL